MTLCPFVIATSDFVGLLVRILYSASFSSYNPLYLIESQHSSPPRSRHQGRQRPYLGDKDWTDAVSRQLLLMSYYHADTFDRRWTRLIDNCTVLLTRHHHCYRAPASSLRYIQEVPSFHIDEVPRFSASTLTAPSSRSPSANVPWLWYFMSPAGGTLSEQPHPIQKKKASHFESRSHPLAHKSTSSSLIV